MRLLWRCGFNRRYPRVRVDGNQRSAAFFGSIGPARGDYRYTLVGTAGLWDEWKDRQSGETIRSCTMIITEPNKFVAEVHNRMPVLLRPDQFEAWLDGSAGKEMLVPAAEDMLNKVPVSQRVNSSRAPNDDPTLIEPVALAA